MCTSSRVSTLFSPSWIPSECRLVAAASFVDWWGRWQSSSTVKRPELEVGWRKWKKTSENSECSSKWTREGAAGPQSCMQWQVFDSPIAEMQWHEFFTTASEYRRQVSRTWGLTLAPPGPKWLQSQHTPFISMSPEPCTRVASGNVCWKKGQIGSHSPAVELSDIMRETEPSQLRVLSSMCCFSLNLSASVSPDTKNNRSCFLFYSLHLPMDYSPPGSSVHGDSPGQNTWVGSCSLLQRIFPTQGSNPGLLHCRHILYHLKHQGSPI